jgi:DNA polymerase-1
VVNFHPKDARVVLIDGSGYIFRAFFGIRPLSTRSGRPTNATFGFINMLMKLLSDVDPDYIAAVFDTKAPTFRKEMYPEYKANRPPPPPELIPQFDDIREVVDAFGLPRLAMEGYEADDIIATLARQAREAGMGPILVISGDKDLLQLVGPDTFMWDTMKDVIYDEAGAEEKMGVPPSKVASYLGLVGDSSDNIPGVAGIGAKSAAQLLQQFDSIEDIFANIEAAPNRAKKKLAAEGALEMAKLSTELATVADDIDLPINLQDARTDGYQMHALYNLFDRLEFNRLIDRIPGLRAAVESGAGVEAPQPSESAPEPKKETKEESAETPETESVIEEHVLIEVPTPADLPAAVATLGAEPICVALAGPPDGPGGRHRPEGFYLRSMQNQCEIFVESGKPEWFQALAPALEALPGRGIVCQHCKTIQRVLLAAGCAPVPVALDTTLGAYLLDPGGSNHSLSEVGLRYGLHFDESLNTPLARNYEQAKERADALAQLREVLAEDLRGAKLEDLLVDVEAPMASVIGQMELNGMPVDPQRLRRLSDELGAMAGVLQTKIWRQASSNFNINSPKQVAVVLFDELGLEPTKKTAKSKSRSTDSSVLEKLSGLHPMPGMILEWRNVVKLKSTYADALPALRHGGTGRIHSSFNQAVTATGRLSSTDPNLQNIPVRSELGKRIRGAFVAPDGQGFVGIDYSQIDLRALAHLSKDAELVRAFNAGGDIHAEAAALLYDLPVDEVSKDHRRNAKAINFGIIYGMGPHRLSGELKIPYKEAKHLIDRYNERFVGVNTFFDKTIEEAAETGFVKTLLGRRRYLPEIKIGKDSGRQSPAYRSAERMARNTPVQGSSADILRLAMIAVQKELEENFTECVMVLQIHDELVFMGPEHQLEDLSKAMCPVMEQIVELAVPLVVNPSIGRSWADI